jgi:hypothetical protein
VGIKSRNQILYNLAAALSLYADISCPYQPLQAIFIISAYTLPVKDLTGLIGAYNAF